MRPMLLLTLLTLVVFACSRRSDELEEPPSEPKISTSFETANRLYNELMGFKDDSEFHQVGFSFGSPYYKWMDQALKLKTDPDAKSLIDKSSTL